MRSSAMTKSAAALPLLMSVVPRTAATTCAPRSLLRFIIWEPLLLPGLIFARMRVGFDDHAVPDVERPAGGHALERLGCRAPVAAVVERRSGLDLFAGGRGELIRVGAVCDGAEPAQIDRGRAAAGKSARMEVVGSGNGQRDVAVGTLEIERDAG